MATSLPPEYQQTVRISPVTPPGSRPVADSSEATDSGSHRHAPHMMLVEGSRPGLSQETLGVLSERLRISSLLIAFAFSVFFLKNLIVGTAFGMVHHPTLLVFQGAVILITGLLGVRMCMKCRHLLKHLRLTELIVFGTPAAYFVYWGYMLLRDAVANGIPATVVYPWLILTFTYALFIPNTWKRAAVAIGAMMAMPMLLMLWMAYGPWAPPELASMPRFHFVFLESTLGMPIAALIAILGVHTINRLRQEAFVARQIGQYRLKKSLGAGGMGEVYLAEHILLKRPCAIKVIRAEKAGDPQALARFEREVRETARLTHWNTIEIFDYGRTDDGTFYYVMEYLPGMNLEQLVDMHGPLPAERVIHLLMQVTDALSEAHAKGLVHRDIKPANIFAARRGGIYDVAKLLDFGLVKPMVQDGDSRVTQDGLVAGSPLYMSPEQALGETPDERSDIYSLGLTAYYLLTGRPPFQADKPIKLLLAHAHETPPPPTQWNPDIPADLEAAVMKCLEKSPDRRFSSADELRTALERCDAAGLWTRAAAYDWWHSFGCPQKKQLDEEVFDEAQTCLL